LFEIFVITLKFVAHARMHAYSKENFRFFGTMLCFPLPMTFLYGLFLSISSKNRVFLASLIQGGDLCELLIWYVNKK